MKKNILKVYHASVMLSAWFLVFLPLLTFVIVIAIFDSSRDSLWIMAVFSALLFFFSAFFILCALYMTQRAKISEHGIVIYSIFFSTIKVIKWNELIDLKTESLVTFSSSYGYRSSMDWIVLYTDSSQKENKHNPFNRKKAGPWYIACTKENITVLTEYVNEYASHISNDPDVFF